MGMEGHPTFEKIISLLKLLKKLIEGMHTLRPGHKLTVQLAMDGSCIESAHVSPYWELDTTYQEERSFEE